MITAEKLRQAAIALKSTEKVIVVEGKKVVTVHENPFCPECGNYYIHDQRCSHTLAHKDEL